MTRLEKAIEISKPIFRDVIIANHCPVDIDPKLPEYDPYTYIFSDCDNGPGCRGITCEECWNKELEG